MNKTAALPTVLINKSTKEKRQKQFEMPPPNDATWSSSILAPMAVQNTRRGCVSGSEVMVRTTMLQEIPRDRRSLKAEEGNVGRETEVLEVCHSARCLNY